jgi:hypothetical protein
VLYLSRPHVDRCSLNPFRCSVLQIFELLVPLEFDVFSTSPDQLTPLVPNDPNTSSTPEKTCVLCEHVKLTDPQTRRSIPIDETIGGPFLGPVNDTTNASAMGLYIHTNCALFSSEVHHFQMPAPPASSTTTTTSTPLIPSTVQTASAPSSSMDTGEDKVASKTDIPKALLKGDIAWYNVRKAIRRSRFILVCIFDHSVDCFAVFTTILLHGHD